MIRRPPRSTLSSSSAASDVYKRQVSTQSTGTRMFGSHVGRRGQQNQRPERRGRQVRCGTVIQKVGPAKWQAGHHLVSLVGVEPAYVDCFFVVAYTAVTLHAGVMVRAPGGVKQIQCTWRDLLSAQLLAHLVVADNTVCIRFDMSDTEVELFQDVACIHQLGDDPECRAIWVGRATERELAGAAVLAGEELEKPLAPLSREEGDTSCLHFAMRLLHRLGCMPKWDWLVQQLPGAPLSAQARSLAKL
eukprot:TRINITY_DN50469_c0_g2_i1.p1 TRINITY_DN50469_c0_g2~~TRINITY_DN50469_c0_g2_i1.p1  ORF type:complete len:246 (-),score=51.72 TRINITY_DN50469_c0_g2_i1:182-919(-)